MGCDNGPCHQVDARQVELEGTVDELRNRLKERDNEVMRMQQQQQQFQAASQQQQQQQIEKLQQQLSQQVRKILLSIGECVLKHRERRFMLYIATWIRNHVGIHHVGIHQHLIHVGISNSQIALTQQQLEQQSEVEKTSRGGLEAELQRSFAKIQQQLLEVVCTNHITVPTKSKFVSCFR